MRLFVISSFPACLPLKPVFVCPELQNRLAGTAARLYAFFRGQRVRLSALRRTHPADAVRSGNVVSSLSAKEKGVAEVTAEGSVFCGWSEYGNRADSIW